MEKPTIAPATSEELDWAADLMARSEPWITLHVAAEQSRLACRNPEHLVYVAHVQGAPCGAMVLHPHGAAGSP